MKKVLIVGLTAVLTLAMLGFMTPGQAEASVAPENLRGRILLQVEDNGEAWYINPSDAMRYYLGRPRDAFDIMRLLGVGASHADIERIPSVLHDNSSQSFAEKWKGYIMLDVEYDGEAWYINPANLLGYYLGRPADAFDIMRGTGLGAKTSIIMAIDPNIQIGGVRFDGTYANEVDEFVMIVNYGEMDQNLGGWTISDREGHTFTFPNYVLEQGQQIRVFTGIETYNFGSNSAIWNNDGDTCYLRSNTGALVDSYGY